MTTHTIQIKFDVTSEGNPTEEDIKAFIEDLFVDDYSKTNTNSTFYFNKENCNTRFELWKSI